METSTKLKPGQKKETPPPGAGTRVFYESLYKQNPNSLMALKWCVEWGVIPAKDATQAASRLENMKQIHKEKMKRRGVGAPVLLKEKKSKKSSSNGSSKSKKSKPQSSDDDESEFI